MISISLGLGSKAIHQAINQKTATGPVQSEAVSSTVGAQPAPERVCAKAREEVRGLNTLIKINADISQVDGMFGTVYNTHSINNVSTCRCIKVKALMERGEYENGSRQAKEALLF